MSNALGTLRVCYTEDSPRWSGVARAFEVFGFTVDHFSSNTDAWEEIKKDPGKYAAFSINNDTGPGTLIGIEVLENLLPILPIIPSYRRVILLTASNASIFTDEKALQFRQAHDVQLCYLFDACFLQAEYARYRLDHPDMLTFEQWLRDIKDIDTSKPDHDLEISKANRDLYRRLGGIQRERAPKVQRETE